MRDLPCQHSEDNACIDADPSIVVVTTMSKWKPPETSAAGPAFGELAEILNSYADLLGGRKVEITAPLSIASCFGDALQGFFDANPQFCQVLSKFAALNGIDLQDAVDTCSAVLSALAMVFTSDDLERAFDEVANEDRLEHAVAASGMTLTTWQEANPLTLLALRNGYIETLHAGKHSDLLDDPELSRITDPEMKRLMVESSRRLSKLLELRDTQPARYLSDILYAHAFFTKDWDKS